jgi:hypothetical protein
MTSLILPNGMIYLMNQSAPTFQQPVLMSMPAQQQLFLANPGLGSQFLSAGNNGSFIFAQPGMTMTSQPQIYLNAPSAQLPILDSRMNFVDGGSFNGSYRLESDDRLTYKRQNGETVKLDILERAILEIPNLANEN